MQGKNKKRERLLSTYESLSPVAKTLVQLCSVIYEPTDATTLINVFRKTSINLSDTSGKVNSVQSLIFQINRLQELQILNGSLQCRDAIVEIATRDAVASGAFGRMMHAVQAELPLKTSYPYNSSRHCARVMRDFRIGIHSGNISLYQESFRRLYYPRCSGIYADPHPLVRVCANPFDADWFSGLPTELQAYALSKIFQNTIARLEPDAEALSFALREDFGSKIHQEQRPQFYYDLVSRLLFAGRLEEAGRHLSEIDKSGFTAGLSGWLRLEEGRLDEAARLFELDLKEYRRRLGKRSIFYRDEPGLFYVLVLLLRQEPSVFPAAERLISLARSAFYDTPHMEQAFLALNAILDLQKLEPDNARMLIKSSAASQHPLVVFLSSLASFWLDGGLTQDRIDAVSRVFIKAREAGLNWLAMECAELLSRAEQPTPVRLQFIKRIQEETGMRSFIPLIRIEEPWRKSLRALIGIDALQSPAAAKKASSRLVWLVGYQEGALSLQPIEQKLSARGGWTRGRPVALGRLYSGQVENLSRQDQLLCAAIKKDYSGYGYTSSYYIEVDEALPGLVGHPLLFLQESPTVPVEVLKGEPEVTITQSDSDILIRFSGKADGSRFMLLRETPTRFRVMELSDEHRRIAKIVGDKGLSVPAAAKDEVLSAISSISSHVTVHSAIGGAAKDLLEREADPTPHLHLLPSGTGFRIEMFVKPFGDGGPYLKPGVGVENIIAEIDGKRMQTRRELKTEAKLADKVEAGCPSLSPFADEDMQWYVDKSEDCLQILLDLKDLQENKTVIVEWPEGEKLRVSREVSFDRLRLKIRSKTDWFELSGQLAVNDNLVMDMKQLLELVRNSGSRFIPLGEGEFLALTQELRRRLQELDAYAEKRGREIRMHPLAAMAVKDIEDYFPHLDADASWKSRLKKIRSVQDFTPSVPSTLKAELRDYQVEGYRWLARLAHLGVGGCLADDMGLGKTIQALAVILDRAPRGPTLVVAPTSVCMNWITEANRFAPTLNAVLFGGNGREELVKSLKDMDVLVTSYGLLHQESGLLASVEWRTVVLDEAQAIKNFMTKRSQAAMNLRGDFKLITTGTPIENHLDEFWTLFNFINPGLLGSRQRFNDRFAIPIERYNDKESRKRLKKLIQPFVLRRMKSQVLEELPPRTEVVLQVEMSAEESAFYEALRREAVEKLEGDEAPATQKHIKILAEIMRLRQAACNPRLVVPKSRISSSKLDLFGDVVSELLENHHKALVFSQFVGHLALIRQYLDEKGIGYRYLDGSTPPRERKKEVDAFQSGDGDLFLISLKAGGLGLNLTAADYVIHMDPWWNPAVEDQASDRAHRIGQQRPVTVYRLVSRHTIEEKIVKLHQEKRDLASSLLEGSDVSGRISAEDLLRLIREE